MVLILPPLHVRTSDQSGSCREEEEAAAVAAAVAAAAAEKEDVKAELKDGYLTVSAETNTKKDEKAEDGKYIRRERYSGSCSRSFYVGDGVKQEDIKAKFEDGTLKLFVPKEAAKPAVEQKKYISIEG